ncbi:hypothetical protein KB206_14585 [Microvirga sp. STS02]|uniref:DUF5694 domain-containing protein n=1 Tax=Hymenobacter negativus TaxID=2795026 RepID=UPI0018DC4FB8|nr:MULTISPECIES: DUF5694 domain-containing protein [Bacteria]MBH8570114.1 hypothetical protein [Hymenobacter negativus]MBR7209854.1 hypothetical protein [Microvirga sp. STS02]
MNAFVSFSCRIAAGMILLTGLAACAGTKTHSTASPATAATTDILLLGCSHLSQLYKAGNPNSDVLTPKRQAELSAVLDGLQRYQPDGILVEELPENQARLDSLYQRYRQGQLDLSALSGGRSEVYQLGFALGKRLGLARIYCVNAPGGTSQSILHEGRNIELYKQADTDWHTFSNPFGQRLLAGTSTIGQFLRTINAPATLRQLHTLVYRTPARVTGGTLKPDEMVDAAFINPQYVGAEFISVFYNRDLKVYSNIVTTQLQTQQHRQLLIIGARHVASLQGIVSDDPAYRVVPTARYLGH